MPKRTTKSVPGATPNASSAMDVAQIQSAVGSVEIPRGAPALATAMSARWPSVLRMHRDASVDFPMATTPVDWYPLALRTVDSEVRPSKSLRYATGDYYLQDAGSLLALAAAGASGESLLGKTVCDLCASPGGKASALLEAIGDDGFLLANEPIRSRIAPLKYNLARTGADRYAISSLDPDRLAETLGGSFDLVLVDAPCSGQALMSRGKQNVASMTQKQIDHSAARQNRILDAAVRLLQPGGQLIYSTCTFADQENELQMSRLVSKGFVVPNPRPELAEYESDSGCYRLWPHLHRCAGGFAASMRLSESLETKPAKLSRKKKKDARLISEKQLPEDWSRWYEAAGIGRRQFQIDGFVLFGQVDDAPPWVGSVAVAGPELAYRTGQTWKPSHEASMRKGSAKLAKQVFELEASAAEDFVGGRTVACGQTGWVVAMFGGGPLGWVKSNGSVGKNHLPSTFRQARVGQSIQTGRF